MECESLVKDVYSKMGLTYKDSSSEDEGGGQGAQSSEIIEIDDDDDDDDVIAVGCGKDTTLSQSSSILFVLRGGCSGLCRTC